MCHCFYIYFTSFLWGISLLEPQYIYCIYCMYYIYRKSICSRAHRSENKRHYITAIWLLKPVLKMSHVSGSAMTLWRAEPETGDPSLRVKKNNKCYLSCPYKHNTCIPTNTLMDMCLTSFEQSKPSSTADSELKWLLSPSTGRRVAFYYKGSIILWQPLCPIVFCSSKLCYCLPSFHKDLFPPAHGE